MTTMKGAIVFLLILVAVAAAGRHQAPSGAVLVSASGGSQVIVLDGHTLERDGAIAVGGNPHEISVTADGKEAYIANTSPAPPDGTISVVNVQAGSVARTLTLPKGCRSHDLRISKDGTRLWTTCAPEQRVVEIDARDGRLLNSWNTGQDGGWMLLSTADERKLYVANLEGKSLSVIHRESNRVSTIPLPGGAMGMDVSPDHSELWIGGFDSDTIWILNIENDRVVATIRDTFKSPGRIRFLPGGRELLIQHARNQLSLVNQATRAIVRTVSLEHPAKCLALTPDGSRVFVSHPTAGGVSVVDVPRMIVSHQTAVAGTPDGIAFVARAR